MWGTLPLNLMRLHIRVNNAELDWLARRAAGVAGVSIYANSHDHAPRFGAAGQPLGGQAGGADSLARQAAMPYRLAPGRHFADFSLVGTCPVCILDSAALCWQLVGRQCCGLSRRRDRTAVDKQSCW